MALRVFSDREGHEWNAWLVRPHVRDGAPLPARYRDGWVCFERADRTGRCRMPADQLPPGWDTLPDERLDLLRRVAEQPVHSGQMRVETTVTRTEDDERAADSGPRRVVAAGED